MGKSLETHFINDLQFQILGSFFSTQRFRECVCVFFPQKYLKYFDFDALMQHLNLISYTTRHLRVRP